MAKTYWYTCEDCGNAPSIARGTLRRAREDAIVHRFVHPRHRTEVRNSVGETFSNHIEKEKENG